MSQFTSPGEAYAAQAAAVSGAPAFTPGMAPYPLFGVGQAETGSVPFYRQPLVCFGAGAAVVGAAWVYFGWWRPSRKHVKKNRLAKLKKELSELESAVEE